MEYSKSWEENDSLRAFVINDCWAAPGTLAIADRKVANNKTNIIRTIGPLGPILDLVIRGTTARLLILNFGHDIRSITSKNGALSKLLTSKINDEDINRIIPLWFESTCVSNFEASYRNSRSSILKGWIRTFTCCPYNQVSMHYYLIKFIKCFKYAYLVDFFQMCY